MLLTWPVIPTHFVTVVIKMNYMLLKTDSNKSLRRSSKLGNKKNSPLLLSMALSHLCQSFVIVVISMVLKTSIKS